MLEVHTLREENEGLLLLNDEKDGLIAERESHFSGAKDAIDRSIRVDSFHCCASVGVSLM